MIKLVYCLTRRADVAPERFHAYWLEQHGPKVRQRKAALHALKYIQSHTVEPELNGLLQASRGMQPPYDGITEVWWDSADTLKAAIATPEGAQAMKDLLDDESTFIEFATSRLFVTEEHSIF